MPDTRTRTHLLRLLARTTEPRWTVSAIARATGVPQPVLHKWLRGNQETIRTERYRKAVEEFVKQRRAR
jgi:transposase-like protein